MDGVYDGLDVIFVFETICVAEKKIVHNLPSFDVFYRLFPFLSCIYRETKSLSKGSFNLKPLSGKGKKETVNFLSFFGLKAKKTVASETNPTAR